MKMGKFPSIWHFVWNEVLPAKADGSEAKAAIEKLSEPAERNLLSAEDIKNGAACECMLLSLSSSLFELMEKSRR